MRFRNDWGRLFLPSPLFFSLWKLFTKTSKIGLPGYHRLSGQLLVFLTSGIWIWNCRSSTQCCHLTFHCAENILFSKIFPTVNECSMERYVQESDYKRKFNINSFLYSAKLGPREGSTNVSPRIFFYVGIPIIFDCGTYPIPVEAHPIFFATRPEDFMHAVQGCIRNSLPIGIIDPSLFFKWVEVCAVKRRR